MVESITETTFKLTDGIILPSSCVFVNGVAFMWDVPPPSFEWRGWSKDMFTVFETVSPKPGESITTLLACLVILASHYLPPF